MKLQSLPNTQTPGTFIAGDFRASILAEGLGITIAQARQLKAGEEIETATIDPEILSAWAGVVKEN